MKKILVPCDFSKPAINAYRFALKSIAKSGGIVHLIYIVEMPVMHDTMLMPVLSVEQDVMDDLTAKAKKNFQKLVDKYEARGVKIRTEVFFGSLTNTIIDYARAKRMDVIIEPPSALEKREREVEMYLEMLV